MNSQRVALSLVGLTFGSAYLIQSHYEAFIRWAHVHFDGTVESEPSDRIRRLTDEVCSQFDLSAEQKSRLSLFLTTLDYPVALGSLRSTGYAFIGIPHFMVYSHESELPTEDAGLYTMNFYYGPYSSIERHRLDLMNLSDEAIMFLVARELLLLGARCRDGSQLFCSSRARAMTTVGGIIGGLYGAYQVTYFLNRRINSPVYWRAPSRFIIYLGLSLLGLLCQWQLAQALRRHTCLTVDRLSANLNTSFLYGGLSYYDWRIRWNTFLYNRSVVAHAKRQKKYTISDFPSACQTERDDVSSSNRDPPAGYFLPSYLGTLKDAHASNDKTYLRKFHIRSGQFTYSKSPRVSSRGNELWCGDGDGFSFGLTEYLALGLVPSVIAWFFHACSYPATSRLRRAQLAAMLDNAEHNSPATMHCEQC